MRWSWETTTFSPGGGLRNLRPALERRGFQAHKFDMSEFIKAGGAAKCLVLKLDGALEAKAPNWGHAVNQGEQQ